MFTYRRSAALAVPLGLLVALTAAQLVHRDETAVEFAGVSFDLEAAGSSAAGWVPAETDWNPTTDPLPVDVADRTPVPGESLDFRVAVRNTAEVPASAVVAVSDPDPAGPGDLFDVLHVQILEDGVLLAEGLAPDVQAVLAGEIAPDRAGYRLVEVRVTTPVTGDDRWAGVRTGVQVIIEGTTL